MVFVMCSQIQRRLAITDDCNGETGADVLGACARFLTIIAQKHHMT